MCAVKIVTKSGGSAKDVLAKYQKKLGDTIGNFGGHPTQAERIPTGLFPFDLATGGGFPKGRCSIIYGPEDSGKSSVAYKSIANHQRLWPDETCTYIAIEPFDGEWAAALGVDLDKLIVLNPLFAEEAADMAGDMLSADDTGLVILDSIAAMITTQEAEKSAEGFSPGSAAMAVGKMVRRTALAMRKAEQEGRTPSLIYINQTRFKIGVMFGNPETMSGGNGPLFQAQLIARFYGKAIKDKAVSEEFPTAREINFMLKKCKVPILSDNGKAEMIVYPHNNLQVGDTDDINTITSRLQDMGELIKLGKGYVIVGNEYPTIAAFKQRVYMDRKYGAEIRKHLIDKMLDLKKDSLMVKNKEITVDADGVIQED